MSEEPKSRIFWVPRVRDPEAPTAAELAAGVPLGEVVDDGLQFTRDETTPVVPLLPNSHRYRVIRHPDGTVDVIREPVYTMTLVSEPDWIVFRPAAGLPAGALPADLDGWWIDRRGAPASGRIVHQGGFVGQFTPTGRFETCDDGAVAEVFEVRP